MHRTLVLGAGYAGLGAARRAAADPRMAVTLVNERSHFVERVRLHQLAAGQVLADLPLADLLVGTGVELVVARLTGIDPDAKTVATTVGAFTYDTLVYALGSRADLGEVPGVAEHAHTVADVDSATRLRDHLDSADSREPRHLVVVGGGLTGVETAAELAESRPELRVAIATRGEILPGVSPRARGHVRAGLARLGVTVCEDVAAAEVTSTALHLADGRELPAGTVVWTAGFLVPDLTKSAGFAVDERGRVVVDGSLRSVSHPDVIAAGDVAAAAATGGEARMSCQTALPMGLCAGANVRRLHEGRALEPVRIRYVWQNVSLGRRDGVTQFTRADDTPLPHAVLTGRASARFKEAVTRSTVGVMRGAWWSGVLS